MNRLLPAPYAPVRFGTGCVIVPIVSIDRQSGKETYSVLDEHEKHTLKRLLAPTFGDWLKAAVA